VIPVVVRGVLTTPTVVFAVFAFTSQGCRGASDEGPVDASDSDAFRADARETTEATLRDSSISEAQPRSDSRAIPEGAAPDTGHRDASTGEAGTDARSEAPSDAGVRDSTSSDASRPDAASSVDAGGTVGGSVSGLVGSGLVLANEGASLSITLNGAFTFSTWERSGSAYSVSVQSSPAAPSQTCIASNAVGVVESSDVMSVVVTCTTDLFTVGGNVSGLAGTVLVSDSSGDAIPVTSNGPFTLPTPIASGQPYDVMVGTPIAPANETCVVTTGSGTVGASNVTNVVVTCSVNPPAAFAPGQVDIEIPIDTGGARLAISPLIYGVNGDISTGLPASVLAAATLVRRGGDRGNSYDWENNVSNGGVENGYSSDMTLATGLAIPTEPAGTDLTMIRANRAAGRATMVPFVLNDYVANSVASNIPWDQAGWNRAPYFDKEVLVKPGPYAATPDLTDGVVYTDEHLAYMRAQFADDITAPGPGQVLVGVDNEADLWEYNFPMLQAGSGDPLYAPNGVEVGQRVTGPEFTSRVISFATKVREIAPQATIVGPAHFGYDGWMCWHELTSPWSDFGDWFMDDFLTAVASASAAAGTRLLDVWDMHWYPQATFDGTTVTALDDAVSPLTAAEVDSIVQGPRSYWDTTYDEGSWITSSDHLNGPAYILTRLQGHLAAGYPGTGLGVSEYFPGGRNHIASGLAVVDSLGVFQRMGVTLAALWPLGDNTGLRYAFGGLELVHDADGNGVRFADTSVMTSNPSPASISVYAGMDVPGRVTVLVVNKTSGAEIVGLRITNAHVLSTVTTYRIDASDPSPVLAEQATVPLSNAYPYAAPALSASMLVFSE